MLDGMGLPDAVANHAGFVMAHAAAIASALKEGELICPFVVVQEGEYRRSIDFEDETQDRAVERAWASLIELGDRVDLWALAREGLKRGPNGKDDVLIVAAWTKGMDEPIVFVQRFLPKAKGGFALVGPIEVQGQAPSTLSAVGQQFLLGVTTHPKGRLWSRWHRDDA
jgi:hypothetical protein